jgi:hypothetical protein
LPFLWLTSYNFIKKSNKINFILLSLSVAATVTTHNVSTMMYLPFTAAWVVYWLVKNKLKYIEIFKLFVSGILGVGLGSFFFIPVLIEQKLIQTKYFTLDYLNYEAHFVTLYQLFISRIWGHGPSIFGPNDDISFAVGWPHWWLIFPLLGISIYLIIKKIKLDKALLILSLLAFFAFSTFLTHGRSDPIWKNIPIMAIIQFPWRFLGLSIFFLSFAAGAFGIFSSKLFKTLIIVIIFLAFILNINFFVPWNYSLKVTDQDKLTGIAWDLQRKSASLDYLPNTAEMAPQSFAPIVPGIITGSGSFSNYIVNTNSFSFDAEIYSDTGSVNIPVMYFPGWTVNSENKELNVIPYGKIGTVSIELPKGKHIVQGRFEDTPIRMAGNIITLVSFLTLLGILCLI